MLIKNIHYRSVNTIVFSYWDWRDRSNSVIRYICRVMAAGEADTLPIGELSTDDKEVGALWLPWQHELSRDKKQFRFHVHCGLRFYNELLKGTKTFAGELELWH